MRTGLIAGSAALERLGLTLAGEPASRLAAVLAMGCSPDTVLWLLHRLPDEQVEAPRVVGVDDWAWHRGHRYAHELRNEVAKGNS